MGLSAVGLAVFAYLATLLSIISELCGVDFGGYFHLQTVVLFSFYAPSASPSARQLSEHFRFILFPATLSQGSTNGVENFTHPATAHIAGVVLMMVGGLILHGLVVIGYSYFYIYRRRSSYLRFSSIDQRNNTSLSEFQTAAITEEQHTFRAALLRGSAQLRLPALSIVVFRWICLYAVFTAVSTFVSVSRNQERHIAAADGAPETFPIINATSSFFAVYLGLVTLVMVVLLLILSWFSMSHPNLLWLHYLSEESTAQGTSSLRPIVKYLFPRPEGAWYDENPGITRHVLAVNSLKWQYSLFGMFRLLCFIVVAILAAASTDARSHALSFESDKTINISAAIACVVCLMHTGVTAVYRPCRHLVAGNVFSILKDLALVLFLVSQCEVVRLPHSTLQEINSNTSVSSSLRDGLEPASIVIMVAVGLCSGIIGIGSAFLEGCYWFPEEFNKRWEIDYQWSMHRSAGHKNAMEQRSEHFTRIAQIITTAREHQFMERCGHTEHREQHGPNHVANYLARFVQLTPNASVGMPLGPVGPLGTSISTPTFEEVPSPSSQPRLPARDPQMPATPSPGGYSPEVIPSNTVSSKDIAVQVDKNDTTFNGLSRPQLDNAGRRPMRGSQLKVSDPLQAILSGRGRDGGTHRGAPTVSFDMASIQVSRPMRSDAVIPAQYGSYYDEHFHQYHHPPRPGYHS